MSIRRRYREKKPVNKTSMTAAIGSAVSIIFFLVCLQLSVMTGGRIGRLLPALGMVLYLASFFELRYGIKERENDETNSWSKALGIWVPAVSILLWTVMYVIGFVAR